MEPNVYHMLQFSHTYIGWVISNKRNDWSQTFNTCMQTDTHTHDTFMHWRLTHIHEKVKEVNWCKIRMGIKRKDMHEKFNKGDSLQLLTWLENIGLKI